MTELTPQQHEILNIPIASRIFLEGPAGCGKTTVGVQRMLGMVHSGIPAGSLLVLTPQQMLQEPYLAPLREPSFPPGGEVIPATIGGLARRMVDLFWPIAAEPAGFTQPGLPPVFLTIETAQYHMARLVRPLLEEGYFSSVTIDRNRLYSQILDNLNKAAAVGFPHTTIGERLSAAWAGESTQRRVYADAQECANRFRAYCLEHNLLDFSLQLEIFTNILWKTPECRRWLTRQYRHLVYDNIEEDIPVAHDLLREWLPEFDSALLIYDTQAGYRRFLGADPESAYTLKDLCDTPLNLQDTFVSSPQVETLNRVLSARLQDPGDRTLEQGWDAPLGRISTRFYPELLDKGMLEIRRMVEEEHTPPGEIVILAPYLSDSLRFAIATRLDGMGLPWRSHRPSRSLRDEQASQCLLTLAALAHPAWGVHPAKFDVALAFMQAIEGMDLVRAQLLANIVYRPKDGTFTSFEQIVPEMQERITYTFGNLFTGLREWLEAYQQEPSPPLDHFLRRLFGEALSQRGFGFHRNLDSARVAASLVESVYKFRLALESSLVDTDQASLGREYLQMLQDGVIAAQYLETWRPDGQDAILVAPAFTFLMSNRPVEVQIWLDAGSSGWSERLYQPLTQPYVLSRAWEREEPGRLWTDADEVDAGRQVLQALVSGLLRRCRREVWLGIPDLGEQGYEQRGPLLKTLWQLQIQSQRLVSP